MRKVQSNNYVIVLYNTNRVLCFGAKPRQAHNQPSQDQRSSPARINTPAQPESTPQPSQHQHSSPADINTPAQPTSTLQHSRHQHSSPANINTLTQRENPHTPAQQNRGQHPPHPRKRRPHQPPHPPQPPTSNLQQGQEKRPPLHLLTSGMWTSHINYVTS